MRDDFGWLDARVAPVRYDVRGVRGVIEGDGLHVNQTWTVWLQYWEGSRPFSPFGVNSDSGRWTVASALDRQCKGSGLVRWGPGTTPVAASTPERTAGAANRRWSHEGWPPSSFLGGPLLRSRRSQRLGTATINTSTRQGLFSLVSDTQRATSDTATTTTPRHHESPSVQPATSFDAASCHHLPPLAPPPSAPAHRRHCPSQA